MISSLKDTVWYKIEMKDLGQAAGSQDRLMHYYNKAKDLYDEQLMDFEKSNLLY